MRVRPVKSIVIFFVTTIALLMAMAVINPTGFQDLKQRVARYIPKPPPEKPISKRLSEAGFRLGQPVLIRIFKQESELEIWMQREAKFEKVFTYPICKWSGALGPKLKEGDRQSPEGYYFASSKQLLPTSRHHRAINTGFPNSFDQLQGRTGTVLMIHGSCTSIGCYAMTHPGIDDIYTMVEEAFNEGQDEIPMHLYPFRLSKENLDKHKNHQWYDFWKNLAEGDALFAATGLPPPVFACGSKYHFAGRAENCQKVAAW
jgi:murein L,D-transpeptidase YafK